MAKAKAQDLPSMDGPGVGKKTIAAVEKAAEKYVEARDARMELTVKETETRAVLVHEMHEAGLTVYDFDDFTVELKQGKEKVVVKRASDPDDENND